MVPPDRKSPFKILLADDASEHSRAAVELLETLRLPKKTIVTALRVFTPLQAAEHATFQRQLDETKTLLKERGIKTETDLVLGYPSEKIIEYADGYAPSWIMIGAKGLRATLGILLGGVVQQVVEYAQWPVLVVRAPFQGLKKVLVVTDGSQFSQRALEFLAQFPLPKSAEVQVIHVMPPLPVATGIEPIVGGGPITSSHVPYIEEALLQAEDVHGQKIIDNAISQLSSSGIQAIGILKRGDAASEIINYARENEINLIVTGSRGLSQLRSLLLGSVTRKLVHYSDCSVLVVKTGME